MPLSEPYEFIDLADGESELLHVTGYQDGTAVIHPKNPTARHLRQHMDQRGLSQPPAVGTPISVEVPVLRLMSTRTDKPEGLAYRDVTSKRLRADLLARFIAGLALPVTLRLTANGHRPQKTYSVEVL
jgi:hypothetical protein